MSAYDLLRGAQGGQAIANLARQLNLPESQVDAAAQALLPSVAHAIERATVTREGLADFLTTVGSGAHERFASDAGALGDKAVADQGNAMATQLFGSARASDAAIQRASMATEISGAILRQLMPYLVSIVLGSLFKGGGGALGDVLKRLPQGGGGRASTPGWPSGDQTGSSPSGAAQPDGNNPFKEMGDLLRGGKNAPAYQGGGMGGGFGLPRTSPSFPLPTPMNVPDMPRGPSMPFPSPSAAPPRPGIGTTGAVRDILGSILGFRGKGLIGWLVSWLLWRMGGRILRGLLGGIFRR